MNQYICIFDHLSMQTQWTNALLKVLLAERISHHNCLAGTPLNGVVMLQPPASSWCQHTVKTSYKLGLSFFLPQSDAYVFRSCLHLILFIPFPLDVGLLMPSTNLVSWWMRKHPVLPRKLRSYGLLDVPDQKFSWYQDPVANQELFLKRIVIYSKTLVACAFASMTVAASL